MKKMTFDESLISLTRDNVWAGDGKLRVWSDDSCDIVDCSAQWCDDHQDSEIVYQDIQEAIETGKDSLETSGGVISWTITPIED